MKILRKHRKHGFTLIEILIAMAIMVVMMTIVWGTFLIINTSHANVVVVNDAKDYAELNMTGIANMLANADLVKASSYPAVTINATEAGEGYTKSAYFDPTSSDLMYYNGGVLTVGIHFDQFTVVDSATGVSKNKWIVRPTYQINNSSITVTLQVYDNSDNELYYTLTRTIFMPNVKTTTTGSGDVLKIRTKSFP